MTVYAFDEQQGLKELNQTLKQILGADLQFRGFTSVGELLKSAGQESYDVLFADLDIHNRRGLYLLGELRYEFPHTNYIGVAAKPSQADALTLHRIFASGYIFKPYDKETLKIRLHICVILSKRFSIYSVYIEWNIPGVSEKDICHKNKTRSIVAIFTPVIRIRSFCYYLGALLFRKNNFPKQIIA